jgi:hypothetical protein
MIDEGEARMIGNRRDVLPPARQEVVDAEHRDVALQQRGAQVRPDEAGAAGDDRVQSALPLAVTLSNGIRR